MIYQSAGKTHLINGGLAVLVGLVLLRVGDRQ
jgi:hypothetical protein